MTQEDKIVLVQMRDLCILIRGQIIQIYTTIEYLIDDTIRRLTFPNESDFIFYTDLFNIKDLNTKTKSRALKYCLENYDKKYNKDTSDVRQKIDNITDKRHKLAHWQLDTTDDGLSLYKQKTQIRLFKPSEKTKEFIYETFNSESTKKLEADSYFIVTELIKIQKESGGGV